MQLEPNVFGSNIVSERNLNTWINSCLQRKPFRAMALAAALTFTGVFVALAAPADIARGVAWLQSQVTTAGGLNQESKVATAQQAQCETAATLLQLTGSNPQLAALFAALQAGNNSSSATESLACTQLLAKRLGQIAANSDLASRRAADGGFAAYAGFTTGNALDTGWALESQLSRLNASEQGQLLTWLQTKQSSNGSFTFEGTANLLSTAIVLRGLKEAASSQATAASMAKKAATWRKKQWLAV